jgi:hypothetical protein
MTPARSCLLDAARALVGSQGQPLADALVPAGIVGVAPAGVAAAVARLATCELAARAIYAGALGLAFTEGPYEAEEAPLWLMHLVNARPWAPLRAIDAARPSALRLATLDAPPQPGDGLWLSAAPGGHPPEHVDACVVDMQRTDIEAEQGGAVPTVYYSAIAGGQPDAAGPSAIALVARTLRWGGSSWLDESGRRVVAVIDGDLLAALYPVPPTPRTSGET